MTFCSCRMWASVGCVCLYYAAIFYLAGLMKIPRAFAFGIHFCVSVAQMHIKTSFGVAA